MTTKKDRRHTGDLVGQQLGDYTLTSRLATGGMAYIYKGMDNKLQREVAIKVLTPDMLEADSSLTERFQREARAIAALEHDNIITIYQYGEQDGMYFLAMKYVPGMDLADELNRLRRTGDKMEIRRALRILEQVASALDYAHNAGIVHRDVKPSNVLLDQNDKAVLTDFGLVLRQSVDQTMGTAFGTPRYISPEQAIASEDATPQSDIYSLAVVLFEILTGRSVFQGATPMEMALSHINEPPPPPRSINPEIPPLVESELLKALSKEPEQRHKTAIEFIQAIKAGYGLTGSGSGGSEPVGFAPTSEVPASKTPILVEFSHASRGEDKPAEKPAKKKRRRRWPTYLSILWLVIVTVGIYIQIERSGIDNTIRDFFGLNPPPPPTQIVLPTETPVPPSETPIIPTDTAIPPTEVVAVVSSDTPVPPSETPVILTDTAIPPTETVVVPSETSAAPTSTGNPSSLVTAITGSGNRLLSLNYSFDSFTMHNHSNFLLDVGGLKFIRGGTDNATDDFSGGDIPSSSLAPGKCVLIQVEGRRIDIPSEWECSNQPVQITRSSNSLFWRSDGINESFEVWSNDTLIGTCPFVIRGQSENCEVDWTVISGGESD